MADPLDTGRGQAPAPSATPKQGVGCAWLLVAVPIAAVIGIVVGTLLSRSDEPSEVRHTLATGDVGTEAWEVVAVRDLEGDRCAFLLLDGEQVTGACTTTPQGVTLGPDAQLTVVFGRAPRDASRVRIVMAEGARTPVDLADPDDQPGGATPADPLELDTVEGGPVGGRYYVAEVARGVHPTGAVEVLAG